MILVPTDRFGPLCWIFLKDITPDIAPESALFGPTQNWHAAPSRTSAPDLSSPAALRRSCVGGRQARCLDERSDTQIHTKPTCIYGASWLCETVHIVTPVTYVISVKSQLTSASTFSLFSSAASFPSSSSS